MRKHILNVLRFSNAKKVAREIRRVLVLEMRKLRAIDRGSAS